MRLSCDGIDDDVPDEDAARRKMVGHSDIFEDASFDHNT